MAPTPTNLQALRAFPSVYGNPIYGKSTHHQPKTSFGESKGRIKLCSDAEVQLLFPMLVFLLFIPCL